MNTQQQQTLNQALEIAKQRLGLFATDPEFLSKMQVAFGETWQLSQGITFGQAWQGGDFTVIPPIEIRPAAEINGANGGYAGATNTIYKCRIYQRQRYQPGSRDPRGVGRNWSCGGLAVE